MIRHGSEPALQVLHHQVLVEKAEGLFARRGGQADEVGVEIFQHLGPEVVDGAVALVGDDDIESLDGDRGVVFDGFGCFENPFQAGGRNLVILVGQFPAFEHGVKPLNSTKQTRAVLSRVLEVRRWTMYSSGNLKLL
jgi:hypothetical protein